MVQKRFKQYPQQKQQQQHNNNDGVNDGSSNIIDTNSTRTWPEVIIDENLIAYKFLFQATTPSKAVIAFATKLKKK